MKKTFNIIFCNQSSFSFSIFNDLSEQDQNNEKQQNDSESDSRSDDAFIDRSDDRMNSKMNAEMSDKIDNKMNIEMSKKVLKQLIKKKYEKNEIMQNIITAKLKKLQRLSQHIMTKEIKLIIKNLEI